MKFDLYFTTTLPTNQKPCTLTPGSKEARDFLWSYPGVTLEPTYNYDETEPYNPGYGSFDGFGHIAVNTNNMYTRSEELEASGVCFKKRPDEGRMKGLDFAYDPENIGSKCSKEEKDTLFLTVLFLAGDAKGQGSSLQRPVLRVSRNEGAGRSPLRS